MYYPEEIIEEVRSRNDIVDVISAYVKLQRRGSSYFGLCPFHNEKTGSFSVSPAKQIYYCFGCGAGGNVVSFIMQYDNCSFPEALKTLADRAGIALPEQTQDKASRARNDRRQSILEINKIAGTYYYYQLRSRGGEAGMEYFTNRGLSRETMQKFGLGYAGRRGDQLVAYLREKGISDERIAASGLAGTDEKRGMYDKFWNRVIFPIMDVNNRIIGFGGRVLGDGKPKYLNSPETEAFDKSRNLYALNIARRSREKYMILCEGYMDVISLHQAGFTNAVASLGTSLTSGHTSLLKRYTQQVVLCYDSDEAGVRAAMRAIPMLREAGITARILNLRPYKDPDELIKAEGADSFRARIEAAEPSFSFILSVTEKNFDLNDPEQKTRFLMQTAQRIAGFEMEVERETYTRAVAERYRVSFEGMRKMVLREILRGGTRPDGARQEDGDGKIARPEAPASRARRSDAGLLESERMLLTWITEYPALYKTVARYIRPEDYSSEIYRSCASLLYAQLSSAGRADPASVIDHFEDPEQQKEAAAIFHASLHTQDRREIAKAVKESIRKVAQAALERREEGLLPSDLGALQAVLERKRVLEELEHLQVELPPAGEE